MSDYELKELMIQMKKQILDVLISFVYFLHVFEKKKCHNMLAFMFDPRSKSTHLVTMFLGRENTTIIIVKYDENLLLPLLMEANKLLMLDRVEKKFDLHSQVDFEGLFHTTTTTTLNTYTNIISKELVGFQRFPIDAKSYKCVLSWWSKDKHKFLTIVILLRHIFSIPTSHTKIERIFSIARILLTHHRCHLQIDNLDKLIFVNKN